MNTAERELAADLRLLKRSARTASAGWRSWTVAAWTVVAGRGSDMAAEIDWDFCLKRGIAVVRRFSGGSSVVVGPGTWQWAIALPEPLLERANPVGSARDIATAAVARVLGLGRDCSGDLLRENRKVGGLAIRKIRGAVLVHGSVLVSADIGLIAAALAHPPREPAYRQRRSHEDFLVNLGPFEAERSGRALEQWVGQLGRGSRQTRPGVLSSRSLPSG